MDAQAWSELVLSMKGIESDIKYIKKIQTDRNKEYDKSLSKIDKAIAKITEINSGFRLDILEDKFKELKAGHSQFYGYVFTLIITIVGTFTATYFAIK